MHDDGLEILGVDDDAEATPAPEQVSDAADPEEKPRRSRRRRALLIGLTVLTVLIVAGVAMAGFYVSRLNRAVSEIAREDLMPAPSPAPLEVQPTQPEPAPAGPKPLNYVLLGSDRRDRSDPGRSDSLILAHVSGDRSKVYLISFPRDLWVDIPGKGKGKINWAYAFGGAPLTVQTLQQLLDVQMDHTAVVDFGGFTELTETLGGVEVYNDRAFSAGGYHFGTGWITLRGAQALAFVRERKSLPNGDLDRAAHQRLVVQAILDKAADPKVLANPAMVDQLIRGMAQSLTVDRGLSDQEIKDTALGMKLTGGRDIVTLQAPMVGFGTAGDQAIDIVDTAQMAELAAALREDRVDDYLSRFPISCTGGPDKGC